METILPQLNSAEAIVLAEWSKEHLKEGDSILHWYSIHGLGSEYEKYSVGIRRAGGHYVLGTVIHRPLVSSPKFTNYLDVA